MATFENLDSLELCSRKNVKSINEKACKSLAFSSYLQVFDGLLLKMDFRILD